MGSPSAALSSSAREMSALHLGGNKFGKARGQGVDKSLVAGVAIALAATLAGIAFSGVKLSYFFQPAAACLVLGGTCGVTLITAPRAALAQAARRVLALFKPQRVSRQALIDEMVAYSRIRRKDGLRGLEPLLKTPEWGQSGGTFLQEALILVLDLGERVELQTALETKLRLSQRQGEADAHVLEVAGGFAPTIGVLGTVVGLIDILHQFSNPSSIAVGIGTAFVSTIYGLSLANLLLLPAACRIRAAVAERSEIDEMMVDGVLGLFDGMNPSLLRERLNGYLPAHPEYR